ncbi:exosome complex component RRP46-like [Liolophura sinensis]|uniref:exosome complex component RRP46-like n=1 Tax=Liolophura sinensis TaxID=3198878 RepID=UPI003158DD98
MDTEPESEVGQLRPMKSSVSVLSRPDGSANVCQGNTCVIAAVYGPSEVKMSKEIIDKATVEVTFKPKTGLPGCAEKLEERLLRNTCETVILAALHPRSSISIIVQELQNSGSLLATSVNAACLALLDACVPMKCIAAAVCAIIDADGQIQLDPTELQEKTASAWVTFAFDSKNFDVITVKTSGIFTQEQFQSCLLACREASKSVFKFYRDAMEKKLSKS